MEKKEDTMEEKEYTMEEKEDNYINEQSMSIIKLSKSIKEPTIEKIEYTIENIEDTMDNKEDTMTTIEDIIEHNEDTTEDLSILFNAISLSTYVVFSNSNKKKDKNSLSSLVSKSLSQSECIRLGFAVEKLLCDICSKTEGFINIKPKNSKGEKEADHLFINNKTKEIYYAEIKTNINLDTEKYKSTTDKILFIMDKLKNKYPNYKINGFLVAARYYDKKIIPSLLLNKYKRINNNVIGVDDYLTLFNKPKFNSEKKYIEWLDAIANTMFT